MKKQFGVYEIKQFSAVIGVSIGTGIDHEYFDALHEWHICQTELEALKYIEDIKKEPDYKHTVFTILPLYS